MQQQVQYLLLFQAFCLGSNELKKEVENGSMINNHQSKVNNYSNQIWGPTKTVQIDLHHHVSAQFD